MKVRKIRTLPLFFPAFLSFFLSRSVFAELSELDVLYKKAETALASKDARRADFYVARYLGLSAHADVLEAGRAAVERFYAAHPPAPAAFISASYDEGFLRWFENAMVPLWGAPGERVREKYGSVEVRNVRSGKYFVAVVAYPKMEAWFAAVEAGESKRFLPVMGSVSKGSRAIVIAGEYVEGRAPISFPPVEINGQSHALQYVWEPRFEDLDGDGMPEIWLRYNLTWGNGFTQFLDVYHILKKELVLVRRFEGPNEGVARRIAPGRVETARGAGSQGGLSHFEYDTHVFETWEFKNGEFEKISERASPHLLRNEAWKEYVDDIL